VKKIREPNLFYKIGSIRENCLFFINISKVLFTGNVRLFFNTHPHIQVGIFLGSYLGVSDVGPICYVVNFDTMKKFVGLTHLIKPNL
jgi:hypothetical protein